MNYLIARKKRTNNTYYNIISDEANFYPIPQDLDPPKIFDNNYKLEDDEWFGIPNFSQTKYSIPLITQDFNSAENNQIGNNEYQGVKFFCAYQNDNIYCFQRFSYGNIISRKWFNLTGEPSLKTEQPILIIKEIPDAIYIKDSDKLYFKKLADIKSIFPNIFDLYKEATDAQTKAFLENDFISLGEDYDKEMVKSANRKRIAMAIETLATLNPQQRTQIHNYIRGYCPGLNFTEANSTFDISNEEHLKLLIFGIEQRFYTTIVGGERRVANSVTTL